MKNKIVLLLLALASHSSLLGATLLQDDFNMNGNLNGQSPDVGSPWSVSGTNLSVSGGALELPSIDGEASSSFASQSNTTLYAGLSFTVTQSPSMAGSFFFSFLSGPMTIGRLFVTSTGNSGTFDIGIENNLDNPVDWTSSLNVGQQYRAVVGFTENGANDISRLWINPLTISSASVADDAETITASLGGIRLHSNDPFPSGSTGTELLVNEIYVGDSFTDAAAVPEPSTSVLVMGGAVVVLAFLRRKKLTRRWRPTI